MNTTPIDSILNRITNDIVKTQQAIPNKDKRILISLAKQITSGTFLTENQANLLVKILKENITLVKAIIPEIEIILSDICWSKSFRKVQKVRKITFDHSRPELFSLQFSFNTKLKDKISKLTSEITGNIFINGNTYTFLLTEDNLHRIISTFSKDDFDIDETLMNFYREIENIKKINAMPFDVFSLDNEKLKNIIIDDIGPIDNSNALLLQDRSIRYQYRLLDTNLPKDTLISKIAGRKHRSIFLNSDATSFTDLVASLKKLKRLPLLIIFDGYKSFKDKAYLNLLKYAVKENLIDDVGIYFRYHSSVDSGNFNQEIAELKFNKNLTDTTVVAGICNNKIPKFMIQKQWKPQTVISFTNSFRNNKGFVYCFDVDLIVYYTQSPPLTKDVDVIL